MSDFAFVDAETRSMLDVTKVGALKYAAHESTRSIMWGHAFEDGGADLWVDTPYGGTGVTPVRLLDHVENGGYVVAWNSFFDRNVWNHTMVRHGWPRLRRRQVLCAQALAESNNLPGSLGAAADTLKLTHRKDPKGKSLIKLLCDATNPWTPKYHVDEIMGHFGRYCKFDVLAMRDVWNQVLPLTDVEWAEFHASEAINDRGVAVDIEFARAARDYAEAEAADLNEQLADITGDPQITLSAHLRKGKWLHEQLWPDEELQGVARKADDAKGRPRYTCDRQTRETVLEALSRDEHSDLFHVEHLDRVINFLEAIEAGNSAAVMKFRAMVNRYHEGRIHGNYSFSGAGQTGRFSSRGLQVHNMVRTPLAKGDPDRALDAINDVVAGREPEHLVDKYGLPLSRLLARLVRPTFVAPEGRQMVWADWDQIEARTLPWLSDSAGGEEQLDIFRSGEDVYSHAAADIYRVPLADITPESDERQVGKVATLALGFGGSIGAFSAMGRNYGLIMPESEMQDIVDNWRAANQWCVQFWYALWEAALSAYKFPSTWYPVGRVAYYYAPGLMNGTLLCRLPCGRMLRYPQFRHKYSKWTVKIKGVKEDREGVRTSFVKGFGGKGTRVDLWYGILAENITQATAASKLRQDIVKMQDFLVLHTHDEPIGECDDSEVVQTMRRMEQVMSHVPEWATGLPLSASVEYGPYYTK